MHNLRDRGKALAKDLAVCTRQRRDEVARLREQLSQLVPTRDQITNVYENTRTDMQHHPTNTQL